MLYWSNCHSSKTTSKNKSALMESLYTFYSLLLKCSFCWNQTTHRSQNSFTKFHCTKSLFNNDRYEKHIVPIFWCDVNIDPIVISVNQFQIFSIRFFWNLFDVVIKIFFSWIFIMIHIEFWFSFIVQRLISIMTKRITPIFLCDDILLIQLPFQRNNFKEYGFTHVVNVYLLLSTPEM